MCSVNKKETTHGSKRTALVGGKSDTHCIFPVLLCEHRQVEKILCKLEGVCVCVWGGGFHIEAIK